VQEEYSVMQCHMPEEQAPECNDQCPWKVWNYLRLLNPSAWMFKNCTHGGIVVFFKQYFYCAAHDLNLYNNLCKINI
jgi:hypothetical protein